jgi:TPR repeat protein
MEKAIQIFESAAKLNNPIAMTNLAVCYKNREGVEQNMKKAI